MYTTFGMFPPGMPNSSRKKYKTSFGWAGNAVNSILGIVYRTVGIGSLLLFFFSGAGWFFPMDFFFPMEFFPADRHF